MTTNMKISYVLQGLFVLQGAVFIYINSEIDILQYFTTPAGFLTLFVEQLPFVLISIFLLVLLYVFHHKGMHPYHKTERKVLFLVLIPFVISIVILASVLGGIQTNNFVYLYFSVGVSFVVFLAVKHFGITFLLML